MIWVAGVDGCPIGWVVVGRDIDGRRALFGMIEALDEVASLLPQSPVAVGIDMPIGLLEAAVPAGRPCDDAARRLLAGRRSSVFSPPVRAVLQARSYEEACDLSRASSPHRLGISRQSFGLVPKLREVDEFVTSDRQDVYFEVHPELSFLAMNDDRPMRFGKKSAQGVIERLRLLDHRGVLDVSQIDLEALGRHRFALDDLMDAAAACWTAERKWRGEAEVLSGESLQDSTGKRMEIWR
ncbi:MAG: DUF429 domain-containing protein [Coriobacteriia bacterium]|nr:DUF429 domain-containing protein [Coriobacteriia bacterium]